MRNLLTFLDLVGFAAASIVMLYQSYAHTLPTIYYYAALALFIAAVVSAIAFGNGLVATIGVFSFFIVVRLMFYLSTRFLVFPFGDPYGQFGVLEAYAQSSHATFLFPTVKIFDDTSYLSVIAYQYSNWPGFQILTLTLARVTGLSLLNTAIALTLLLDMAWFGVSYCLIGKILSRMSPTLPNFVPLCMAIITALPSTAPLPSYFKYDFPATICMLLGVLFLLRVYDDRDHRATIPLLLLSAGIVVTHSITAFAWVLILAAFLLWSLFMLPIANKLPTHLKNILIERTLANSARRLYPSITSLFAFMLVAVVSWTTFYAAYLKKYLSVSLPKIAGTISLSSFSVSRLSSGQASLTAQTPRWILQVLSVRDRALLGLLFAGVLLILVRPSLVKRVHVRILLLTVAAASVVTELSGALSFGDRAFELFAPLLGIIIVAPILQVALLRIRLGKIVAVGLIVLFMASVGIGFWGSSYAPTGLYTNGANVSVASGRPLSYPAVASFMSYSSNQSCILTNEIYATSLSVPVSEWSVTKLIGVVKIQPRCVTIVFNGIYSTIDSNVSAFGFGEPYVPYNGFSPGPFYSSLNARSDKVFATDNESIYYQL